MEAQTKEHKAFSDPNWTARREPRASVPPSLLKTLWINTGSLCNLSCTNCYMESSPKNNSLNYINTNEVISYLNEIKSLNFKTHQIAYTGGEPFMNPDIISILDESLKRGFEVLVLTNAMAPMKKHEQALLDLKKKYSDKILIRVSLDHYTEKFHSEQRGLKSWTPALKGLSWLSQNKFKISIGGRSLWNESEENSRKGYEKLFSEMNIKINSFDSEQLILFPEMTDQKDIPEISTSCWKTLNKKPSQMMCSTSRMIVKRRGFSKTSVAACTLIPYDLNFDLGHSLKESWKNIKLNHPYCSQFCVLGGGSCSK